MMKRNIAGLAVAGALALGGGAAAAAVKPAHDVSVKMKIAEVTSVGPLANLTVKNLGTNTVDVQVRVCAETEAGLELFATTVTGLLPKKSAKIAARCYLDADTTALTAEASIVGAADEDPTDNLARGGLGLKGAALKILAGRAPWLASCASCHGDAAEGGAQGPAVVGAKSKTILLKVAEGGSHAFPWLGKVDAKNMFMFLKAPGAVVLPPALPAPPAGGWPTFAGNVKPIYDVRCVDCHGPVLAERMIRLDLYNGAANNAKNSLLQIKLGKMPQGGARLPAAEIQTIEDWITGGKRP
jgi:mono/diheme cytochrome c family protein